MALTDSHLRNIKPGAKPQKISDGFGLYLHVAVTGAQLWRLAYRFNGKQKTLSLGRYPAVSLKEARYRRDEAKKQLDAGIDPGAAKKEARKTAETKAWEQAATFQKIALEWHQTKTVACTPSYRKQLLQRLDMLHPFIGQIPITKLEPADILRALRHAETRGAVETAHRLAQIAGKVCRYARLTGYSNNNPADGLVEALQPVKTQHRAAILDPAEIGHLLRALDGYPGDISISYALRIMPYVFIRSGELRAALWSEINLDAAEWIITPQRMKMKRPHVVPLARQVIKLLTEIRELTGNGALVFPSPSTATRCISDVGILTALRRLGYNKDTMCIHGFRAIASTLLNEQGYRPDVIEAQLAHAERNSVRKAYNHAVYLPERRSMMQEWADYLDKLRSNAAPH